MAGVSIGLVGCGGMGHRHLHAYRALKAAGSHSCEVTAVCDPRSSAASAAADLVETFQRSRPAVFSDHEELIASRAAEALDIVTDPSVHHVVAVPALDEGIHVICEKPLGLTVRACRLMLDAAARSGAVLATAENYRRDPPNRLARAVIERGLLGDIHLMQQTNIGGDDAVIISPWRHVLESGSIALDMGVHYTDLFAYFLGPLERVSGSSFIAEPVRVLAAGQQVGQGIEEVAPGVMRATGDDSIVALYHAESGVPIQLAFIPSGPGRLVQRVVHGRRGTMSVPPDRSGGAVTVQIGDRTLAGAELRRELGGFGLEGVSVAFFGPAGTEYDLPFSAVDAATIAIELDDFARAIAERRAPEVDGLDGLLAVAGVWAVAESTLRSCEISIAEVAEGTHATAQQAVDLAMGLLPETLGGTT